MTTEAGPAWARGYPLDELRAVAGLYREADAPYALGAFSRVKEATVADWLDRSQLMAYSEGKVPGWQPSLAEPPRAAAQCVQVRRPLPVRDFTGAVVATVPARHVIVRHPAAISGEAWADLLDLFTGWALDGAPAWLEGWAESPHIRLLAFAADLELVATKIKASSELVGVWGPRDTQHLVVSAADQVTLGHLRVELGYDAVQAAAAEVEAVGTSTWADHYSSYNVRHSWSALSLQGFGHEPDDILKPAEMSKAWKAEHPGWEQWPLRPTPLAPKMPAVWQLVRRLSSALGGAEFQRVRLMRLQPGGGELTRHSDITDPEAGTDDGKLARIHIPLITNPDVRFRQWRLSGEQVEASMGVGEVWYLDTRKPHKAGNYGTTERVHLVADAYVTSQARQLIAEAAEARPAPEAVAP